ncbi:protein of unknown function [Candidatus Nitrosocaldus cavascurensis]|uniref:Uncharacterized protein n=1 Tax=Candidatus Nitrosocaldus cavascurensis TaxID=2058097 RepID=A0A2K5AR31_9ARCH|nr:protein of unknown function [Candidatus Nitrosocaldus cavascurensis]
MITITIPLADYTYATHNSLPVIEPMEHYIAGRNMISMASYYTMENHLPSSLLLHTLLMIHTASLSQSQPARQMFQRKIQSN